VVLGHSGGQYRYLLLQFAPFFVIINTMDKMIEDINILNSKMFVVIKTRLLLLKITTEVLFISPLGIHFYVVVIHVILFYKQNSVDNCARCNAVIS